MQSYLVLVNPGAGSVDDDVDESRDDSWRDDRDLVAVHDELARHGEVDVALVDGDDEVLAAVEAADDDTVLVVVGGDGTLHRFLNLLDGRPNAVLLLPGGTGNDFAGGVGLPEDLVEAAALAGPGGVRSMDLLRMGPVAAMNAAHLGIGAEAAQAASGMKERLGKLAYSAGAVRAAAEFEPIEVTVRVDDEVLLDRAPVAFVGLFNGPRVGGGTVMCPGADPGDGLLDLVVLTADTRTELAATTAAILAGTHLERDDVLHRRARAVSVTLHDAASARWNVDGELLDLPARIDCEVDVGAWQLLTPRS